MNVTLRCMNINLRSSIKDKSCWGQLLDDEPRLVRSFNLLILPHRDSHWAGICLQTYTHIQKLWGSVVLWVINEEWYVIYQCKITCSHTSVQLKCYYLDECDSSSSAGDAADHLVTELPDELVRDHKHQQVSSLRSITELRDSHLWRKPKNDFYTMHHMGFEKSCEVSLSSD